MCVSVCVVVFYFTAAAADGDDRSLDGDTMVNTRFAVRKTAPCNVWRGKLLGPECAVSFSCYTYARNSAFAVRPVLSSIRSTEATWI